MPQLDQARKVEIINSDTNLTVEHKSNTSLPDETLPPQSPSYSQRHQNKTVTNKINLESLESYITEPVDQFIDYLVEGKETVIPKEPETSLNLINTLYKELETRNLPIVNLVSFDENPCNWPELMADFISRVHFKRNFSDNMRRERLLSVLRGEAKKSVESIAKSSVFLQQD